MSTICKLDPEVRRQRAMRRNLLRNPPKGAHPVVLAELAVIAQAPHLSGATKDLLFRRGAAQL
jgi:hypothetical protein